jgi:hypothetical protein
MPVARAECYKRLPAAAAFFVVDIRCAADISAASPLIATLV